MREIACREREKEQAENITCLRYRHDLEREDKQVREARDKTLSPQGKGLRKETGTERDTQDKRQRCDPDSWHHPRR